MSRHRILIVDDDEDVRKVMSTALSTRYEVVQATDGLDALHKLDDYQPDFAIVDAMMPLMDGYQLCEAVRRHDGFKAIPVLFLSAYGSKENIKRGYAAGANLFMTKPIDPLRVLKNVDFTINHEKPSIRNKRYTLKQLRERDAEHEKSFPRSRPAASRPGNGQAQTRPAHGSHDSAVGHSHDRPAQPRPAAPRPDPQPRPAPRRPAPPPPPPPVSFGPITDHEHLDFEEEIVMRPAAAPGPAAPPPSPPVQEPVAEQPLPTPYPPTYTRPQRGPVPRIMIVDNDDDTREMMDVTLRSDFEVTTARDGVEAIENIVMYQPDLMVVDIMMPKMNGYQLIQSLRRNVAYKDLPIIVVSGKATPRDQAYVTKLGANAFLPKPFDIDVLKQTVDAYTTAEGFQIGEKRLPINEVIEREFLKAKERSAQSDQKDRQRKFSELQEILNEDASQRRQP